MRVADLARELGKSPSDMVALLRASGEWVASHRSSVPPPVIRRYLPDGPSDELEPEQRHVSAADTPPAPARASFPTRPPRPRSRKRPGPKRLTKKRHLRPEDAEWDDPVRNLEFEPQITTRDAAELLRVSSATIRQWVRRGHIEPVGRFGSAHLFRTRELLAAAAEIEARRRATPGHSGPDMPAIYSIPGRDRRKTVTAAEAALLADVSPSTIRSWVHRGHLTPLTAAAQRPAHFLVQDVIDAAVARRLPGRQRQGRAL